MSDPISDLLTRLRNAKAVNKNTAIIPFSKYKQAILAVMQKEGFINGVEIKNIDKVKFLVVNIENSKITHLRMLSKPGQRNYVAKKSIPRPLRGMGLVILSTPKGVVSGKEALKLSTGGELICEVW